MWAGLIWCRTRRDPHARIAVTYILAEIETGPRLAVRRNRASALRLCACTPWLGKPMLMHGSSRGEPLGAVDCGSIADAFGITTARGWRQQDPPTQWLSIFNQTPACRMSMAVGSSFEAQSADDTVAIAT